jgi:hypothetical protein
MEKSRSIRKNFTRDVVAVTFMIAVLVMSIMIYLAVQAQRRISEQYIRDATGRAASEFRTMASSVEDSLGMVRGWGEAGLVALSNPDKLQSLLFPIFAKERLLSGISIADSEGHCYFILPDGSDIRSFEEYDPRTRPWFKPALEADDVQWTEHYLFHTLQQIGVTASDSFAGSGTNTPLVVAFDILLTDLYRKIDEMAPSENSDAFIFREGEILMMSDTGKDVTDFLSVQSISNAVLTRAHAVWRKEGGSDDKMFSFVLGGNTWWCGFRPLSEARRDVWMGVVVPEADIVGDIGRHRAGLIGLGVFIILICITGAAWLSRRYSSSVNPVDAAGVENTDENIRTLITGGENRSVEFKSTMRMNLHSGKPGKEIELAWLKAVSAFLNTDGGTLLLGVTDAGEITGLERDVFENEDKCRLHFKNLIANHIGAELSKHIRFLLVPLEDRTVGVVRCARCSEPVFLKDGSKEYFYIRNGPASDELPVSKALKYIKHRK